MIQSFIGTLGTRIIVMLFTVITIFLNTHQLGAEGQGTVALIQLGILIAVSLSNYIGGGAVVYLTPRVGGAQMLLPSYLWAIIVASSLYGVFKFTDLLPSAYALHMSTLGLLQSLFMFHLMVLLGKEKIGRYNLVLIAQALTLMVFLALLYRFNSPQISAFIRALYFSFGFAFAMAFVFSMKQFKGQLSFSIEAIREMLRYGVPGQSGNLVQLLNYRMNLLLLEHLGSGRALVGIYSIGLYGSEAIWNVSKSLATVQYARISNEENISESEAITVRFFHVSFVISFLLILCAVAIPSSAYQWLFGDDIIGLRELLLVLAPGILANACSGIFSHHFSGQGKPVYNLIASLASFIVLLPLGYLLIPTKGIQGAATAASIGYCIQFLVLLAFMLKKSEVKIHHLIPKFESFRIMD